MHDAAVLIWSAAAALLVTWLIWRVDSSAGDRPWFGLLVGAMIVAGGAAYALG